MIKLALGNTYSLIFWFIPAILLLLLLTRAKRASRIELILRFLVVTSLLFALLGPYVEKKLPFSRATVVVDISDSMDDGLSEELLERIRAWQKNNLEIDILPFAAKAGDLYPLTSEIPSFKQLKSQGASLNIGETNIENAFKNSAINQGMNILFLSDGFETKGNIHSYIQELRNKDIRIFPIFPKQTSNLSKQMHISQLTAPLIAPLNQSVEIRVSISNPSESSESGSLEIKHDNKLVLLSNIELPAGTETVYTAQSDPAKDGIREVTATFKPSNPTLASNTSTIYLTGETKEKVLLLSGSFEDARFLVPVLSDEAYQLKSTFEPESSLFEDLNSYAAVIFNNISKTQVPPDSLSKISSYVRRGGAFVMVGGERSFGLGEYRDSPIEEILPVRLLPPQSKQKRLTIAVELVVDKSKSMVEDQRLEFVKDAAREVIRNLKDDDLVGITAFDTMPFIAVPLGAVGQIKQMAMDRISILFPTGKTNLLPAMAQARQALENAQSGRKHMIILTDGDLPDSGPHYTELVRQMRFSGITVSTVLIGSEFDRTLRQMADVGGGAFYNTRDPQALPRIFLRDIKVRSGEETMKEQQEFEVRKGPGSLESTSLRSFPSLYGFVQTQIKENANLELVIRSSADSQSYPLLGSWNVDKGKVIAFTSDANGRWSRGWIGWSNFREFWDDLLSTAQPSLKEHTESIKFDLRYYLEGASLILDLTFISPMQGKKLNSELVLPDTSKRNLEFQNIAKSRFRSELRDPLPGKYEFTGSIGDKKLTPIAFNLSGELFGEKKGRGFNIPLLEELASLNGAKTNPEYSEILAKQSEKIEKRDLSTYFILLAFLLLMLEIASRELLQKTQKSKTRRAAPLTPRGIRQLLHPFTRNY